MNEKIIKASLFTPGLFGRWGTPIIYEGKPGTAKTSKIGEIVRDCGFQMQTIVASLREPSDFLGLPIPTKVKKRSDADKLIFKDIDTQITYSPAEWAINCAKQTRTVVFFDEINTAPPAVQAALLRVILEGSVGEFKLPNTVRFIAAQNATEDAAGGWDLAAPLANRFGHRDWSAPDAESWGDWLLSGGNAGDSHAKAMDPIAEERRIEANWQEPWAKARGLIAGFIRRRPDLLMQMPETGSPRASKAWASPRTWELAARAHASSALNDLSLAESEEFMAAFVGAAPLGEFATWQAEADLPEPKDVLDGKVKFKHDPARLDRSAAILQACAAFVIPEKCDKRQERASKLWEILTDIEGAVDVVVPPARVMVQAGLATIDSARKILVDLQPVLSAANVRPKR